MNNYAKHRVTIMEHTAKELIEIRRNKWETDHNINRDKLFREGIATELIENPKLRQEVRDNPEYLIELEFVIVNKDKETVPFFLNEVQRDFVDRLKQAIEQYELGLIVEIALMVLKGRQQGFTSLITAYQLASILLRKNFEGFTIADTSSNTEAIFENKAKFPYNQIPDRLKPTEKYNNRRELRFEKLNSTWAVETATKDVGRSRTVNFFHSSEGAFYDCGFQTIQASIGEAMTKDCIKIYESTAHGLNDFYDMWTSGVYINCFYEWWRTPEYRTRFESDGARQEFDKVLDGDGWISKRLRWLRERETDLEQCYWYYKKYVGYLDKELIKQEYPCTPEEAFLMSGRPVFNQEKIVQRIADLKDKKYREGHFSFKWHDPETRDYILDDSIKFVEAAKGTKGSIRIYEDPQKGLPYVIGGDTKGEGKDYYAATVINNATGNRCATLHMKLMDSKPFTYQMYCLGRYFNGALIGIEINFNTAPIEELQRLRYPRQYTRQKYDEITKSYQKKYGWKTDGNTRPLIIDKEVDMVENYIELFNDVEMLRECLTFVYVEKNDRPDAMPGKHDDILFSDMIANEIRQQQRTMMIEEVEKPRSKLTDLLKLDRSIKSLTGR
jgi:hypothetical protein